MSSCRAAGFDSCCTDVTGCYGMTTDGYCLCDTACRSYGDCCDDIDLTCPSEC